MNDLIMETMNELKQVIKEQNALGNIVFADIDGLKTMPISDFISQPSDGILYDLNRNEATTYALASTEDIRWINDIAVAQTIRELKKQIEIL